MDPYKQILESTLFMFDWGQDCPENHCTSQESSLTSNDVLTADPFICAIAKYHNWYNSFSAADPTQLLRADVVRYRSEILGIILSRLMNEHSTHPIIRIYATECQLYNEQQDCISCLPFTTVNSRNSKLIHSCIYIFLQKTQKNHKNYKKYWKIKYKIKKNGDTKKQ